MLRTLFLLILTSLIAGNAAARGPLVLAASSMQEALTDAADLWVATGNERPVLSFASSSALARQIGAGAPADLFVSADAMWLDHVAALGQVKPGARRVIATNRLVFVRPDGTAQPPRTVEGMLHALGTGRLAIADPDTVPAGRYARDALISLGMWNEVENRLARGENVRAALALVERNASPLGVVYRTDAEASDKVFRAATFRADRHAPIVYHAAQLRKSRHPDARGFLAFLAGPRGQAALRARGFGAPPE